MHKVSGEERKNLAAIVESYGLDVEFRNGHPFSIEGVVVSKHKWSVLKQYVAGVLTGSKRQSVQPSLLSAHSDATLRTVEDAWNYVTDRYHGEVSFENTGNPFDLLKALAKLGIKSKYSGGAVWIDGKKLSD